MFPIVPILRIFLFPHHLVIISFLFYMPYDIIPISFQHAFRHDSHFFPRCLLALFPSLSNMPFGIILISFQHAFRRLSHENVITLYHLFSFVILSISCNLTSIISHAHPDAYSALT